LCRQHQLAIVGQAVELPRLRGSKVRQEAGAISRWKSGPGKAEQAAWKRVLRESEGNVGQGTVILAKQLLRKSAMKSNVTIDRGSCRSRMAGHGSAPTFSQNYKTN